jgi:alpha/beta superfamily hydrolase
LDAQGAEKLLGHAAALMACKAGRSDERWSPVAGWKFGAVVVSFLTQRRDCSLLFFTPLFWEPKLKRITFEKQESHCKIIVNVYNEIVHHVSS